MTVTSKVVSSKAYVVCVETPIGWLKADGIHETRYRTIEEANKACARYRKDHPASSYKVVTVNK